MFCERERVCLFVLLIYLPLYTMTEEFKTYKSGTYFRVETIQRDLNSSIITKTYSIDSVAVCSYKCVKLKSMSLYFVAIERKCSCNEGFDRGEITDPQKPEALYAVLVQEVELSSYEGFTKTRIYPLKMDCLALFENGFTTDGVYTIQPSSTDDSFDTWCDMKFGGWTVIQRRLDGSENFLRKWAEYVDGFGNRTGEYWIGLENIRLLTRYKPNLFISMRAFSEENPITAYAQYRKFKVYSSSVHYRLKVTGFTGDCGDSLQKHSGMGFTTIDSDNDNSTENCASKYTGGWWYKNCHRSNLNGLYYKGDAKYGKGIIWSTCWEFTTSLKHVTMMVRRR